MTGSRSTACSDFTEKEIAKINEPRMILALRVIRWSVARVLQSQRLNANLWVASFIRNDNASASRS